MNEFQAILTVVIYFAARFAVPAVAIYFFARVMRHFSEPEEPVARPGVAR